MCSYQFLRVSNSVILFQFCGAMTPFEMADTIKRYLSALSLFMCILLMFFIFVLSGIRTLQCVLLKVALLVGAEVYVNTSFDELRPPEDQSSESEYSTVVAVRGSGIHVLPFQFAFRYYQTTHWYLEYVILNEWFQSNLVIDLLSISWPYYVDPNLCCDMALMG